MLPILEYHLHHEAQIALDKFLECVLIPLHNTATKCCLCLRREAWRAAHLGYVRDTCKKVS